jgi:hypothetical protein
MASETPPQTVEHAEPAGGVSLAYVVCFAPLRGADVLTEWTLDSFAITFGRQDV